MSRISRRSSYQRLIFCVKKIGHYTYILGYCLLSARFYLYMGHSPERGYICVTWVGKYKLFFGFIGYQIRIYFDLHVHACVIQSFIYNWIEFQLESQIYMSYLIALNLT